MDENNSDLYSAFGLVEGGYAKYISFLCREIQKLFQEDPHPWVVGYSGGKDSTAALQLVWLALEQLPKGVRNKKKVHVISTDTMVENPAVASWVLSSLKSINASACQKKMPFEAHLLQPDRKNTFWVNMIGRGYPRPWSKFRWCTERLKIFPSNAFIENITNKYGETILVLGTRKYESSRRKANMEKHEKHRLRERLSLTKHGNNCLVYTPLEDWADHDVWAFLSLNKNPWGGDNQELTELYKDATEDRECPMVVELKKETPSCGKSRFGCWTCTHVSRDSSLENMVANAPDKKWLSPLLDYRKHLTLKNEKKFRDFRRMSGNVEFYNGKPIRGPYLQSRREFLLRELLETEKKLRQDAPLHFNDIRLITDEELREIRRIWVVDKHEIEDTLPGIYEEVTGKPFPHLGMQHYHCFGERELELLREVCGEDRLGYEMIRELLGLEWDYQTKLRRAGLHDKIDYIIRKTFFKDEDDAVLFSKKIIDIKDVGTKQ